MMDRTIEALCDKLGVTMEYLIPKLASYLQASRGIILIILSILIIIFSSTAIWSYKKEKETEKETGSDNDVFMSLSVLSAMVLIVLFVIWPIVFHKTMMSIISPEISAINYLLDKFR